MNNQMTNIRIVKLSLLTLISSFVLFLSGCSTGYNYGPSRSAQRNIPTIPEVQAPVVKRPKQRTKAVQRRPKPPVRKAAPRVQKYTITSKSTVIATPNSEEIAARREVLKMEAKKRATVDIDPYATIPENSSSKRGGTSSPRMKSSPAVKSLMLRARADLAVGNTQSAVTKLERGLRIEAQNPSIWYLLAKAHYAQDDYQQSISMAKKSIRYSGSSTADDKLVTQNWQLIKKSAEKSDDTIALKEALNYFKVNP